MDPSCRGEGDQKSFPGGALLHSLHRLRGSPSEQRSLEEKPTRVKRRLTRRERNSLRFGRNATDKAPDRRPGCRGLQKMLPPFWGSQLRHCPQSTPIRGNCGAKPVIITQKRLTQQHLGMFNREVKSADIERLLSPRTEQEVISEVTPICRDDSVEKPQEEHIQPHKPPCESATHKSLRAEQFECAGKDLSAASNEDSLHVIPVPVAEPHHAAAVEAIEAEPRALATSAVLEFNPEATETEVFQSNTSVVLNEKENVPPDAIASGIEPAKGRSLVKELAQDLQRLLDLKAMFPGRNLISETRLAVISALREQNKTLPDLTALASLKMLTSGCDRGGIQADFKSPANRDQEERWLESKCSSCSSQNSDQGVSLKTKRGQEEFFLASFSPSSGHTEMRMAEESSGQREIFESWIEPEVIDQNSFHPTTVHSHPHLRSASSQHMNSPRISIVSEEQCPLHEALLRTSQHWEQGSVEAFWGPRGRQGRPEAASERVLPKKQISKRCCLPSTGCGPLGSSSLSINGSSSELFLLTDPLPYSHVYELSPHVSNLHGTEPVPVHGLHHSQELHCSQLLNLGLRNPERAPTESQTSFDVLKSIWSPKLPRKETTVPVSHPLARPHLACQLSSSRALNMERGQPKAFLQLYSIIPEQPCASFYRQNPLQEVTVSSRVPQQGNDLFSVLAKPRVHCQKVSVEQEKTSESYPVWGLAEAPERIQGTREKSHSSRSESQTGDLERLLRLEGAHELQVFQQLPMSYFPPSETLEESGKPPLCTLEGHLLGQASPEPWAFPRMKLY